MTPNSKSIQEYYEKKAENYLSKRTSKYHRLIGDLIDENIARFSFKGRILDAGSGPGILSSRFSEARTWIELDLSRRMLDQNLSGRSLRIQADLKHLPFRNVSFDGVIALKVLPHVQDIEIVIREMTRVLKPGGLMALEFYNRASFRGLLYKIDSMFFSKREWAGIYTRFDNSQELRSRLSHLEIIKILGIRFLVPCAFVFRIPILSRLVEKMEIRMSHAGYSRFAGFQIAICRKRS